MINVYPISSKLIKYCSHCDKVAVYEIWFSNPKIVQQCCCGCFCEKCMKRLKDQINKVVHCDCKKYNICDLKNNNCNSKWPCYI